MNKLLQFYYLFPAYRNYKVNKFVNKKKSEFKILINQNQINYPFWDYDSVINYVKQRKSKKQVCHIIASGSSVLDTIHQVKEEDFVIGFSFSALLNLKYDLYFVEFATDKIKSYESISNAQCSLIKHANNNINQLLFKNLWQDKIDTKYIHNNYKFHHPIVKDIYFKNKWCAFRPINTKLVATNLLKFDSEFMKQSFTTTLTCVLVSAHSLFDKIIIHGWDFEGPYFYCDDSIVWPNEIAKQDIALLKKDCSTFKMHSTYNDRIEDVIRILKNELSKNGVNILSASSSNRLSKIIGH